MSTSDRELLEFAARAAGGIDTAAVGNSWDGFMHLMVLWEEDKDYADWNPLTDDGDALRLAVNLSFDVDIDYDGCVIHAPDLEGWISEIAKDGDVLAATRRAIVRAAAEIGRSMP